MFPLLTWKWYRFYHLTPDSKANKAPVINNNNVLNCVLDDRCNGLQTSVRLFVCLDKHQHLATVFFYHEVSCYGSIISPDSKTVSHSVTHFLLNSFPLPVSTHSHTCYSLFLKLLYVFYSKRFHWLSVLSIFLICLKSPLLLSFLSLHLTLPSLCLLYNICNTDYILCCLINQNQLELALYIAAAGRARGGRWMSMF